MSRLYDALKVSQERRPANPSSQSSVVNSPGPPDKDRRGPSQSRKTRTGTLPLFHADLEENYKLWVENCFPDAVPAREDAIRQWLAKPPEFRAQSFLDDRVKAQKPDDSLISTTAQQKEATRINSRELTQDANSHTEQHSPWRGSRANDPMDGPWSFPRLVLRFAKYLVLSFLIVGIVWAAFKDRKLVKGDALVAAATTPKPEPSPNSSALGFGQDLESVKQHDSTDQPMKIENITVGCEGIEPCVEIDTQGAGSSTPTLSALGDPDRLVLDFSNAVYSSDLHPKTVGQDPIKAIRIAESQTDQFPSTRVVIDLTAQCDYEARAFANRFVVTILPKDAPRQPTRTGDEEP
jgi:hypothetical protein